MNAIGLTLFAMIFYSMGNLLMELKLSKYDSLSVLVGFTSVIFISMLGLRLWTKTAETISFTELPIGSLILLGLLYTAADYCYITAYTKGIDAITATSVLLLIPVLVAGYKHLAFATIPNMWQVFGYVFGIMSIAFIAKGNPGT